MDATSGINVRYAGPIAALHDLMGRFDAARLSPVLRPGPTPDVSVVVHPGVGIDDPSWLLGAIVGAWSLEWPSAEAELLPWARAASGGRSPR